MFRKLFVSFFVIVIVLAGTLPAAAQDQDDRDRGPVVGQRQLTTLIDCPTAGTLQRGSFDAFMEFYPKGGIIGGTDIGLSNRLTIGISYGAEGIIAEERPNWNPRIEFSVKLSLIDEGLLFPAVTLGFCSQGYGSYIEEYQRYAFKSKGFYAVASKNYPIYGWQAGFHGGVNYSMEQEDKDENLDFFVGFDTRLNQSVGLVMEYDFATNDDRDVTSVGKGRGYLNLALQWLYSDNLVMEALLKNLNDNRKGVADIWRGFRVTYVEYF